MDKADLPFLSVAELGHLIKTKEVSPLEVTEAYLERIDDLDFKFNAYLTVCRKDALEAARQAEQAIAQGNYLGPMHGIPVAVKDQLWSKGVRTTGGSRILGDFIPEEDATAIANLKRAGAILLGKTNLPEFGGGGGERYSTPHNPWNLDKYTGMSSSGSGAATAAFLCATALGEDTGGSIRFPAAWCGLVGLRPSFGRVSRYGVMRIIWSMDAIGPMARTVEDAAIILGAIAGHDPKDPYTWDISVPDYRKALDGDVRGIRVGVIKELLNSELVEPLVKDSVAKAISLLGELGASIEDVSLPLAKHERQINSVPQLLEPAWNHRGWIRERFRELDHANRTGLLVGSVIPAQYYYKSQKLRSMLRQQVHDALEKYDVLALPTVGKAAQNIGTFDPPIGSKEAEPRFPYLLTTFFSLANSPAISVPCGFTSEGLPIGLQIGGRPFDEETVLKVAHAYEQNTPWHTMRPPTVDVQRKSPS